jgi:hypothetical protein
MAAMPISLARRRATLAKRTLACGSALVFAVTIGLARSSHPAGAAVRASGSSLTSARSANNNGSGSTSGSQNPSTSGGFGQADVGPASSSQAPSVSTGAS